MELHDCLMVGLRIGRIELDEIWGYVGKKQKRVERHEVSHKGDQHTFVAPGSSKAIITYRMGKRDSETTDNNDLVRRFERNVMAWRPGAISL